MVMLGNNAGQLHFDLFDECDREHADALSAHRMARRDRPDDRAALATEEPHAALQHAVGTGLVITRTSLPAVLGRDQWRAWIGEAEPTPTRTPVPLAQPEPELVGLHVAELPYLDRAGVIAIIGSGVVTEAVGDDKVVVRFEAADGSGEQCETVPSSLVFRYRCVPLLPVDASVLPPALVSAFKSMPRSSSGRLGAFELDCSEVGLVASACGCSQHIPIMLESHDEGSSEWCAVAQFMFHELKARAAGAPPSAAAWPSDPGRLGAALKRAFFSAGPLALPPPPPPPPASDPAAHAFQLNSTPPTGTPRIAPFESSLATKFPFAFALGACASSVAEFDSFLLDTPEFTESRRDRHAFVKAKPDRLLSALDRFLRRVTTVESLAEQHAGASGEDLLNVLAEFESASENSATSNGAVPPPAQPGHHAVGGGASLSEQISTALGKTRPVGSLEAVAMREAARRLGANEAALSRLHQMHKLAVSKDYKGLEMAKANETDQDLLLLMQADSGEEIPKLLAGVLGEGNISSVYSVRLGLDERILHIAWPNEPLRSSKQSKAVHSVRCGRIKECRLLNLIDMTDTKFTAESPLAGFATHGKEANGLFLESIHLVNQILALVSPEQTSELLVFFRTLGDLFKKMVGRGASWAMLSKFYVAVMKEVQKPVDAFARGSGGVGVMLDLNIALLARNTNARDTLEESLIDARSASTGKAVTKVLPPTLPLPVTVSYSSADYAKLKAKVDTDIGERGGKAPCYQFFIKGSCKAGADCKFGHAPEGKAGFYAPKPGQ